MATDAQTASSGFIWPWAEPFFFPRGEKAVLLVHGFTATPQEMRFLGAYLAERGYTALGVRLAGHATSPRDMARTTWQDWAASVEDGWHLLRSAGHRTIAVVGLSLGGALALYHATRFPVAAVGVLAAPYRLPKHPLMPLLPLLRWIMPYWSKRFWRPPLVDPVRLPEVHLSYPAYPIRSLLTFRDFLAHLHPRLARVTAPALFVYATGDSIAPVAHMELYARAISSAHKVRVLQRVNRHVITLGANREEVYQAVGEFLDRVLAAPRAEPHPPPPEGAHEA
ncbi:MAG: alpha/beta fold hydrolase [Chloroflexi bacterium]|nr:alpha/beta fold hydrolase [Chloroflexota bacterium]